MPIIFGQVGAPSNTSAPDSTNLPILQGKQGDVIASELHGKYYTQNYRGNLYYASTAAAGVTVSIFSNASYTGLALWNQSSGANAKNLSIVRTLWAPQTVNTAVAGLGYAWLQNAGTAIGTAAPLSAITAVTATRGPANTALTSGQGNSVAVAVSAATLTTAMGWGRFSGGAVATGAITVQTSLGVIIEEFDGTMLVGPGSFWAMTSAIASGGTAWGLSAIWEETPL
jgi:hypothetical protein